MVSSLSALMIQGNETLVSTYSNKEKTEYGFIVYMLKNEEIHTKIISTLPNTPYKSKEEALKEGNFLVEEIRKLDLGQKKSKLVKIIGEEDAKIVGEMVEETKR